MEKRKITILYGSQTGTALEVAERIFREAKRFLFNAKLSAMDDFDITELIQEPLVIFTASTTGQGEEPDNMKKFWRFLLRKNLPRDSLVRMKFGVIGLGDSSYEKFNFVGKRLSRRLSQLGGEALVDVALADDQHDLGPDAVIDPWLKEFWEKALEMYPIPEGLAPISSDVMPKSKFRISHELREENGESESVGVFNQNNPYQAKLLSNERQTSKDHFQDTRLIVFENPGQKLSYNPGDVCMVMPSNSEENVELFFELFPHINRDQSLTLLPNDENIPLPSFFKKSRTWGEIVKIFLDIQSIPRRYFFELLAHFTTDELEKEKFQEFCLAEGTQERYDYCDRPRRNILEVLHDFRHTTPNIKPAEFIFDLIPQIKPRAFSIASSAVSNPGEIQLLVAVVKYRSKLVKPRIGLCSNWLAELPRGQTVPIWIKKGSFRFPSDDNPAPVILVGPGTGVAPFRSFVSDQISRKTGRRIVLFFGCRKKADDFYFENEWKTFEAESSFQLFSAFSRDQEDKIYVQHQIEEQKSLIRKLIVEEGGYFYIAGNAKQMPVQVKEALKKGLNENEEQANIYLVEMERTGRFQTETWS